MWCRLLGEAGLDVEVAGVKAKVKSKKSKVKSLREVWRIMSSIIIVGGGCLIFVA